MIGITLHCDHEGCGREQFFPCSDLAMIPDCKPMTETAVDLASAVGWRAYGDNSLHVTHPDIDILCPEHAGSRVRS